MKGRLESIVHTNLASILLLSLSACSPLEGASNAKSIGLDQWAASYLDRGEKLVCMRKKNEEYFFLAQEVAGNRVKIGSLVDMSLYRNQNHALIVAWKFRNERGNPLVANVKPSTVQETYVKDRDKTYAENVQYQTLNIEGSEEIHVTIEIKKCPTADCDRQQTKSPEEQHYTIELCEVRITK